jgi:predicted heme/steroid binding protein
VVYDVTNASNWSNGSHNGQRLAGTDASSVILSSPHGKSVLSGLPVVGTLVTD